VFRFKPFHMTLFACLKVGAPYQISLSGWIIVLDGELVGPAHFFGAKVGLAKPPAAHRVAKANVTRPTPGVDIRLFGRQLNARKGPARALCAAP
jgi:hypothetical protein